MNQIKSFNLQVKSNIEYPVNIEYYKKYKDQKFVHHIEEISKTF